MIVSVGRHPAGKNLPECIVGPIQFRTWHILQGSNIAGPTTTTSTTANNTSGHHALTISPVPQGPWVVEISSKSTALTSHWPNFRTVLVICCWAPTYQDHILSVQEALVLPSYLYSSVSPVAWWMLEPGG